MAKINGFRVKNYRTLRDITIGKLWNMQKAKPLSAMTAVIGKNGTGKSTLFDAFGFLADCVKNGVEEACDNTGRGGFDRLRAQGVNEPIEFEVYYSEDGRSRPITYELSIDKDNSGRPFVLYERLRQRRKGQRHGWPFSFLILNNGRGIVWKGDTEGKVNDEEAIQQFLEGRNCIDFKKEMLDLLATCCPKPIALFRIAIEEMEAWYLGDRNALIKAYPRGKTVVLDRYVQDSICGTWEIFADAIYPGGSKKLKDEGWPAPGRAKCEWATKIARHMVWRLTNRRVSVYLGTV